MEAIVQRQERLPAKRNDDGLFLRPFASVGPIGRSLTELRFFHLATVF
jgi:hypothetical protein